MESAGHQRHRRPHCAKRPLPLGYRTKVRPGSLGLSPASLKLKRSFGKRGDLAHHHGIITLLEDQEVVGNGIRAAELLRLAVLVQRPGELPIAGQGQFDRGAIRTRRGPVAHEARRICRLRRRRRLARYRLLGSTRCGNALEQLGGQLVLGIQSHDCP